MTEKKITSIEIKPGATIRKGVSMRGNCFYIDCIATCEDGTKVEFHVDTERKKNVMSSFEHKQKSCAAGAMKASFNDEGKFWGTVEQFVMGSGGLHPEAHDGV